jgi:hypothetical protein
MARVIQVASISPSTTFQNMIINTAKFYLLISFAYFVKVPIAYLNFYAEDGMIFFQEANDMPFPLDLLKPTGGYLILVSKIIGRLLTLFPIEILPFVNFIFVCISIAFICAVTWSNLSNLIFNNYLKLICCCSIIFLPIINFELMASSCSLHFLLIFPTVLILINLRNKESIKNIDVFILVMTFLSDPLSIMCIAILVKPENLRNYKFIYHKNKKIYIVIFISAAIQCLYVIYSYITGVRGILNSSSFVKTVYLYLDRVVGSSLIPNWGFVNSNDVASGVFNEKIIMRGSIALIIIFGLFFFTLQLYRKIRNDKMAIYQPMESIIILFIISTSYWLFAGYLFNPEPRYAIFPSICLITIILMLFDFFIKEKFSKKILGFSFQKCGVLFISGLLISTWMFSIKPSSLRTEGPTWESELISARNLCKNQDQKFAKLRILPITANWFVTLECVKLISSRAEVDPENGAAV